MQSKSYIGSKIWLDNNCVISQVCEARAGEAEKTSEERERACTVKMLVKITIELGLKNRNPLFPELETVAVCCVVIRCVCV